jgi:hypothetical protein
MEIRGVAAVLKKGGREIPLKWHSCNESPSIVTTLATELVHLAGS